MLETVDSDHVWACRQCLIHVGCEEEVISKDFTGSTGRAYLVSNCVNFRTGAPLQSAHAATPKSKRAFWHRSRATVLRASDRVWSVCARADFEQLATAGAWLVPAPGADWSQQTAV